MLRTPTSEHIHAWGVAQLLLLNREEAIAALQRAAGEAPNDPRIHSDLAVAFLERARHEGRPEDWLRAMASAERAGLLAASLTEALFNRAVIAEAMGLRHEAIRLWDAYLARDARGDWRPEAERRAAALRAAVRPPGTIADRMRRACGTGDASVLAEIASTEPQLAREFAEDRLLPEWGGHEIARRKTEATQTLLAVRAIARVLRAHDSLLADALEGIDALDTAADTARQRLARAYVLFGDARRLYESNAVAQAAPIFEDARRLFADPAHPFAVWSRLHVAIAQYYRGEYAAVRSDMAALERVARLRGYAIAGARAAWMQGLVANLESDFRTALQHFERAEAIFTNAGEVYNRAAVQNILATIYLYIGSEQDVWRRTLAALNGSQDDPSYRRRHTQLMTAAHEAVRNGLPAAALSFQSEAVRLDDEWGDPAALTELHSYRARTLALLDRKREAEEALGVARRRIETVSDALLRRRLEAEVFQTEVDVLVQTDPRRGVEAANRAITYFAGMKSSLRLPRLYLARGRTWQLLGANDRALEDFTVAAEHFEMERKTLPRSQQLRLSHVDELWSVYPAMVDAAQRSGASCRALLGAAERGRAFNLRETRGRQNADHASLPVVAADEIILHYTFISGRLLILSLYPGGCDIHVVPVTLQQVERAGSTWVRSWTEGTGESNGAGAELFKWLIAPAWTRISSARRLGVVLDGPLHQLPLAALPIGGDRRLIHQVDLRVLPTLVLRDPEELRAHQPALARDVAVVATGGGSASDSLPNLPFAEREVAVVRRLLGDAGVTLPASTGEPLSQQLTSARIFHFAGHAVVNPTFPLLSRLMLSGRDERWITAREIADMRPSKLQLVVLSACDTERGDVFGGDGPASLGRAFLTAGAREVVATLWPVQDRATSTFVESFYRRWLRNGNAPAALRDAMLSNMSNGHTDWAAWVAVTSF